MTEQDIKSKNLVLISYLNTLINGYKVKAEYSTNDNDVKVIVVTETSGEKVVFFDNNNSLFNYYDIQIYGDNIQNAKEIAAINGTLPHNIMFAKSSTKFIILNKTYSMKTLIIWLIDILRYIAGIIFFIYVSPHSQV